ncbi:TolC family protein [Clostridium cochlearium]|uniref:TolC family protein n=1 Tax=Clostridium cochlearium TaxID=1494 RepID=A0A7Y3Y0Q5_CLOCO|nr:TolC family protein [Clostridium cochlearium]NOH17285.1 TolC family protein [Clostridium cochlearium]
MKRKIILSLLIISTICFFQKPQSNIVRAEENNQGQVLDIDVLVEKAVENSIEVKNRKSTIEILENGFQDNINASNSLDRRLEENERFKKLQNKSERTDEEQREYEGYQRIYGAPITDDYELFQILQSSNNLIALSEFEIFQNKNALEVDKNSVRQKVYEGYEKFLMEMDKLKLAEDKYKNAEDEYKKAEISYKNGAISKTEYTGKQAEYLKEKGEFSKVEREFQKYNMEFNKLLGQPLDKKYSNYKKDLTLDKSTLKSQDEYIKEALENRIEIKNGKENILVRRFEGGAAKGVFSDEHHRERKLAEQKIENAEDELELKKLDIKMEINLLYNDFEIKLVRLKNLEEGYKQAKKEYNEAYKRYSLGMLSRLDFNRKNAEFIENSMDYKKAEREAYIAKLKLEFASSQGTDSKKVFYQ